MHFITLPLIRLLMSAVCVPPYRYGFQYFDEDSPSNETMEEKRKEKSKKSRILYNTMEYLEDPEDDSNVEKGYGNLFMVSVSK